MMFGRSGIIQGNIQISLDHTPLEEKAAAAAPEDLITHQSVTAAALPTTRLYHNEDLELGKEVILLVLFGLSGLFQFFSSEILRFGIFALLVVFWWLRTAIKKKIRFQLDAEKKNINTQK